MPHVSDGGGVDLSSNDEIKVFQVEGEGEDEERSSSENLKEVKNSLVAEVPDEEVGCVKSCSVYFSFSVWISISCRCHYRNAKDSRLIFAFFVYRRKMYKFPASLSYLQKIPN